MKWSQWKPWYNKIAQELQIDWNDDERVAQVMLELLSFDSEQTEQLFQIICSKCSSTAIVCGAGPSLLNDIESLLSFEELLPSFSLFAADGAVNALNDYNLQPFMVVSDLDGCFTKLIEILKDDSSFVSILAHGNNGQLVEDFLTTVKKEKITTPFLPTIQHKQTEVPLYNFGGFTDGDRAVCQALSFGCIKIGLIGFDFHEEPGLYSKPPKFHNNEYLKRKRKKLHFAEDFLSNLEQLGIVLSNLSQNGFVLSLVKSETMKYFFEDF